MFTDERNAAYGHLLLAGLLFALAACSGTPADKSATASTAASTPVITSDGTDFYLTFPDHICSSDPGSCVNGTVSNKLVIAAAAAATGNVTFNGISTTFAVSANGSTIVSLDAGVVLTANDTVESRGIHVTSDTPVSVHAVSENISSADGYLALPTNGLGTNYRIMSYASSRYYGSEFAMVATQDATTVTITPSASGASRLAGTAYSITLNAGQTYQLQNTGAADMTGSLISADKPIAVFGGHRCVDIPNATGYCDYLVEQLPDTSVWGNTFQTMPFSGRTRYTVRILASMDGTTISSSPAGLVNATLNAGQYADLVLSSAAEFSSNNPVLVAQYINGFEDDGAKMGDPSMVLVTPIEMGMTSSTFGVYALTGSSGSMLNIVTQSSALAGLMLDGTVVDSTKFAPVSSNSLYSKATLPVSAGVHKLSGTAAFSAMVYDYGTAWNAVSYAWPVATMLSLPDSNTVASNTPATGTCEDEEDEHHHHHRVRHEHHHYWGKYCLIHHTAHRHDGDDHEYECH